MNRVMLSSACCLSVTLTLAVAAASAGAQEQYRIPEHPFSGEPRGPYRTGTVEELWIDEQHEETTTSDPSDKRHLMINLWYPATFEGDPPRALYVPRRDLYPSTARFLTRVADARTTSVLGADLAVESVRYPVSVYGAGAGDKPFSATFQTEFLASHGYIVVGIGHTGITNIERFPDGYVYSQDRGDPSLSEEETRTLSDAQQLELLVKRYSELVMPLHVQDVRFVLDQLAARNATEGDRFYQRLDLERVGAFGWSLGGALALQVSRDEPRIKVAVDLDGWLYSNLDSGTRQPRLLMHSDIALERDALTASEREEAALAESKIWRMIANTDADWFDVTLKGASHQHFSDRLLFEPANPQRMHPRLAHDIINVYTLEFFDKYLRHRTDVPLLSGRLSYADVAIVKNAR